MDWLLCLPNGNRRLEIMCERGLAAVSSKRKSPGDVSMDWLLTESKLISFDDSHSIGQICHRILYQTAEISGQPSNRYEKLWKNRVAPGGPRHIRALLGASGKSMNEGVWYA